jgi:cell volume regulation protein A
MATGAFEVFGGIAALIFLGFIGHLIFTKLRFNDTLILIGIGVILGPVTGILPVDTFASVSLIVGPLALILILFDGGLALAIKDLVGGAKEASILGFTGFTLTTAIVGGLTALLFPPMPILVGLILGAILGGTSAIVVLPSLANMRLQRKSTGITLGLESAITDVLVVVVSFAFISIVALGQEGVVESITRSLVITAAMSIFIGVAVGFIWIWLLPLLRDKPFAHMLTLGAMFALYVLVEWLLRDTSQGGGPLAVLAFGVVLGNAHSFGEGIRARAGDTFSQDLKKFQGELAFIVRTFFFVFLGALVDLELLADLRIWAAGLLIFFVMVGIRYVAVAVTVKHLKFSGDDWVLLVMMPRGLAAAVLAAIPASMSPPIPGTDVFVALALIALIMTNVLATFGGLAIETTTNRARKQVEKKLAEP